MPIELSEYLRMSNTKSARAAKKRELEEKLRRLEAKKPLVIASISQCGNYSDEEKELILKINDLVMSADGTAEGWGGYDFDPLDYVETSAEIFDLIKNFTAPQSKGY